MRKSKASSVLRVLCLAAVGCGGGSADPSASVALSAAPPASVARSNAATSASIPSATATPARSTLRVVAEALPATVVRVGAGASFVEERQELVAWGGAIRTRTEKSPSVGAKAHELVVLNPNGKLSMRPIAGAAGSGLFLPAVAYGANALHVFGGWAPDGPAPSDTFHVLAMGGDEVTGRPVPKKAPWPSARNGAAMVFVPTPPRLVLFAGDGGTAEGADVLDDLWTYDLGAGQWTKNDKREPWPSERWHAAMAVDPAGTRLWMFGGAGPGFDRSVWELDLATMRWRALATTGDWPESMQGMTLTYDAAARALLVVGGLLNVEPGPATSRKAFVLDLDKLVWQSLESPLFARREHVAVYDPVAKAHYVLGGCTSEEIGNFYRMGPPVVTTARIRIER